VESVVSQSQVTYRIRKHGGKSKETDLQRRLGWLQLAKIHRQQKHHQITLRFMYIVLCSLGKEAWVKVDSKEASQSKPTSGVDTAYTYDIAYNPMMERMYLWI